MSQPGWQSIYIYRPIYTYIREKSTHQPDCLTNRERRFRGWHQLPHATSLRPRFSTCGVTNSCRRTIPHSLWHHQWPELHVVSFITALMQAIRRDTMVTLGELVSDLPWRYLKLFLTGVHGNTINNSEYDIVHHLTTFLYFAPGVPFIYNIRPTGKQLHGENKCNSSMHLRTGQRSQTG